MIPSVTKPDGEPRAYHRGHRDGSASFLERSDVGPVLRDRYPIEMLQAIVVVWLFAGLRSNELRRLERDCIRWEYSLLAQ